MNNQWLKELIQEIKANPVNALIEFVGGILIFGFLYVFMIVMFALIPYSS